MAACMDRVQSELLAGRLEKITHLSPIGGESTAAESYDDVRVLQSHHARLRPMANVLTQGGMWGRGSGRRNGRPFEVKLPRLVAEPGAQYADRRKRLEAAIRANLRGLGYGGSRV